MTGRRTAERCRLGPVLDLLVGASLIPNEGACENLIRGHNTEELARDGVGVIPLLVGFWQHQMLWLVVGFHLPEK